MTLSPRTRTVLAWLLFAATFGCLAAGLAVALVLVRPLTLAVLAEGALAAGLYLGFAVLGLVLSLRRPGNPIGWLLAASGLVWSLNVPGEAWVSNLAATGRPLPRLAQVHAAVLEPLWAPAIALGVTLPLLLLPNGRLRSPRWRWAVAASVAGGVLSMASALGPGQLVSTPIANPLALDGLGGVVAGAVAGLGGLLHAASLAAALVCMVLRFRSSRGVERQQLRWVAAGAAVAVIGLLAVVALLALEETSGFAPGAWLVALALALPSLPVAIGVAVLRYRLWDLDRLVSRTVTYAVVTALLVLPYLAIVAAIPRLAEGSGSLAVAAATLAAAALFQPLRRRVQDLVDRRFNRRRYDAARTLDGFAARLRDQVDLDALEGELLAVVDQTMQPARSTLWLRPPATPGPQR
ncbi:MAG TPA: hypothetical protein VE265_00940 [Actinomycetota bacterium]|nr:hypothetical protein [Actinomycetota bacterium]